LKIKGEDPKRVAERKNDGNGKTANNKEECVNDEEGFECKGNFLTLGEVRPTVKKRKAKGRHWVIELD
jgi:hypothetical protein